ncbi:Uncharacterised protein [uncultured archaeon]|nr:Uncharacterised protein [uncultured archaeon]
MRSAACSSPNVAGGLCRWHLMASLVRTMSATGEFLSNLRLPGEAETMFLKAFSSISWL